MKLTHPLIALLAAAYLQGGVSAQAPVLPPQTQAQEPAKNDKPVTTLLLPDIKRPGASVSGRWLARVAKMSVSYLAGHRLCERNENTFATKGNPSVFAASDVGIHHSWFQRRAHHLEPSPSLIAAVGLDI